MQNRKGLLHSNNDLEIGNTYLFEIEMSSLLSKAQISVSHLNGKNLSLIKLAEQMLFASKLNLMYLSLNYYQETFLFISVDDLLKKYNICI